MICAPLMASCFISAMDLARFSDLSLVQDICTIPILIFFVFNAFFFYANLARENKKGKEKVQYATDRNHLWIYERF